MAEGDRAAMRANDVSAPGEAAPVLVAPPVLPSPPSALGMAAGAGRRSDAGPEPAFGAEALRRADEDRWLASRFAPPPRRAQLETLYSFIFEVARTAEVVTEPALGVIRLAWWRDAMNGGAGAAQGLPGAMKALMEETPLDADRVIGLIGARELDLEEAPFEGWGDLEAYIDATAGAAAYLALQVCLGSEAWPRQATDCARAVGRAWGFTGLMRAAPVWAARRRSFLPRRLMEHLNVKPEAIYAGGGAHVVQQARLAMLDRARYAYHQARDLARVMPVAAFPAIGYVALEPLYRSGLMDQASPPPPSLLRRQWRLLTASALGRF